MLVVVNFKLKAHSRCSCHNNIGLIYPVLRFWCNTCDKTIRCDHMGKQNIIKHCETQGHLDRGKLCKSQSRLTFSKPATSEVLKRTEAEVRMAVLTASCNIPFTFHDQLLPAIRSFSRTQKLLQTIIQHQRKLCAC